MDDRFQSISWQGLSFHAPASWNPVKVEGDFAKGSLLLADLHAARLGVRWRQLAKREEPAALIRRLMGEEIGALAADEAVTRAAEHWQHAFLYRDPAPPGRDVWIGFSRDSNRVVQVVHHANRRQRPEFEAALDSLRDANADAPRQWSMFDLQLISPPGYVLQWYRLNAGDHTLAFRDADQQQVLIRQIRPAGLALARQPLAQWLAIQPASATRFYRAVDEPQHVKLPIGGERCDGLSAVAARRRRMRFAWKVPPRQVLLAFHDRARDRLVVGQGPDAERANLLLQGIGWRGRFGTMDTADGTSIVELGQR
ncbi:MAG: hypothetical protein ACTHLZ_00545 [Tepidisphaeraceae bacterium]